MARAPRLACSPRAIKVTLTHRLARSRACGQERARCCTTLPGLALGALSIPVVQPLAEARDVAHARERRAACCLRLDGNALLEHVQLASGERIVNHLMLRSQHLSVALSLRLEGVSWQQAWAVIPRM